MNFKALSNKREIIIAVSSALMIATILVLVSYQLGATVEHERLATSTEPAYLKDYEVVVIPPVEGVEEPTILPIEETLFEYVAVIDSCGVHYDGECVLVRSGPGTEYEAVTRLRNDIVLKVGGSVERDGKTWYKIVFDEWLRYPDRVKGDWYISADYVEVLYDEGDKTVWDSEYTDGELGKIVVDLSDQTLTAYADDAEVLKFPISTGLKSTPTPRGNFTIFKKTPSRYMQGPLPNLPANQYYDLPGVPWNLYFTEGGAVIHGAYWHDSFGETYSHGCVNLEPEDARKLYNWAELGMKVIVQD